MSFVLPAVPFKEFKQKASSYDDFAHLFGFKNIQEMRDVFVIESTKKESSISLEDLEKKFKYEDLL